MGFLIQQLWKTQFSCILNLPIALLALIKFRECSTYCLLSIVETIFLFYEIFHQLLFVFIILKEVNLTLYSLLIDNLNLFDDLLLLNSLMIFIF
jgi:hypothetical protein